ncbi:MAG TPA: phospholipase [Deltaproteobacteria bacterium]|nr:phospholipase [Deltaproteobacteria bacterium]HPP79621.1 phospholipase [Deltaproteobacteria bacterium]
MGDEASQRLETAAIVIVEAICAFEGALRRLHPASIGALREGLLLRAGGLASVTKTLSAEAAGARSDEARCMADAAGLLMDAISLFGNGDDPARAFLAALQSVRPFCRAHELLFPLASSIPTLRSLFEEGAAACTPGAPRGGRPGPEDLLVHKTSLGDDPYGRGGYSLFVPSSGRGRPVPLVVAMHGGSGHGRDFLWTWLREARSRGFILMAPTSSGRTWSLDDIARDAERVAGHIDEVCSKHQVDRTRVLLTGVSDGGTFALGLGLGDWLSAPDIAPVACVLPRVDLKAARSRRILWVHGALDWMFPVGTAARACEELSRAGCDVRLRIIQDLAHAYPREENDAILGWFDHSLRSPCAET